MNQNEKPYRFITWIAIPVLILATNLYKEN